MTNQPNFPDDRLAASKRRVTMAGLLALQSFALGAPGLLLVLYSVYTVVAMGGIFGLALALVQLVPAVLLLFMAIWLVVVQRRVVPGRVGGTALHVTQLAVIVIGILTVVFGLVARTFFVLDSYGVVVAGLGLVGILVLSQSKRPS